MDEMNVQVVTLPFMRYASGWAYGTEPEEEAWKKLQAWAKAKGLLEARGDFQPRVFGFDNPMSAMGTPNHGYEFWVTFEEDREVQVEGDIRLGTFGGGLYAMMPLTITDPWKEIPAGWQRLDAWVHEHGREMGSHQWLEEHDAEGHLKALYYALRG